jgi:hypothetical protein
MDAPWSKCSKCSVPNAQPSLGPKIVYCRLHHFEVCWYVDSYIVCSLVVYNLYFASSHKNKSSEVKSCDHGGQGLVSPTRETPIQESRNLMNKMWNCLAIALNVRSLISRGTSFINGGELLRQEVQTAAVERFSETKRKLMESIPIVTICEI